MLEANETAWERKRVEFIEIEKRLQGLGCAHVDLYNCKERIAQVLVGNIEELDRIVRKFNTGAERASANFEQFTGINPFRTIRSVSYTHLTLPTIYSV